MSFYDADDFDEEFLDEEEEANGFEITMAAVFEGRGDDVAVATASARALADETIFDGDWELDEGKVVSEAEGRIKVEFTATAVVEADSVEEAIDIAAGELSDDWELVGDPTPIYIDPEDY